MSRLARQFDARWAILVLIMGVVHCWTEHYAPTKAVRAAIQHALPHRTAPLPLNMPPRPVCESSGCYCHGATLAVAVTIPIDSAWTYLFQAEPNRLHGASHLECLSWERVHHEQNPPVFYVRALSVCADLQSFLL